MDAPRAVPGILRAILQQAVRTVGRYFLRPERRLTQLEPLPCYSEVMRVVDTGSSRAAPYISDHLPTIICHELALMLSVTAVPAWTQRDTNAVTIPSETLLMVSMFAFGVLDHTCSGTRQRQRN